MSCGVAVVGRLIVLLTALSQYFWNAACIFTCISGFISSAVLNILCTSFGTSLMPVIFPVFAIFIISALV